MHSGSAWDEISFRNSRAEKKVFEEGLTGGKLYGTVSSMTVDQTFLNRVSAINWNCKYRAGYTITVNHDKVDGHRVYIQVVAHIPDVITGQMSTQKGGKHYLSSFMTDTEIVRKIFGAYEMFDRHEIFEAFTYKGARIFGPHIDVDALAEVSERVSVR